MLCHDRTASRLAAVEVLAVAVAAARVVGAGGSLWRAGEGVLEQGVRVRLRCRHLECDGDGDSDSDSDYRALRLAL
jgi:hypothetical protein